mgnify:CR=1 FL=1
MNAVLRHAPPDLRTQVEGRGPDDPVCTPPEDTTPAATVVGLHHFYGSGQTFHRLGPLLADRGLRLVAFDRVGFGLTDRPAPGRRLTGPDSPYTRGFAVRQVVALLDHNEDGARLDLVAPV